MRGEGSAGASRGPVKAYMPSSSCSTQNPTLNQCDMCPPPSYGSMTCGPIVNRRFNQTITNKALIAAGWPVQRWKFTIVQEMSVAGPVVKVVLNWKIILSC